MASRRGLARGVRGYTSDVGGLRSHETVFVTRRGRCPQA